MSTVSHVTISQARRIVGKSRRTVWRWVKEDSIKCVMVGEQKMIPLHWLWERSKRVSRG